MFLARSIRGALSILSLAAALLLIGASSALLGVCGPFADVTDAAFCPFVLEIFTLGITTGTSPTTYDPATPVSRLQMAAFLSRTVDGVLKRGSSHAALNRFWTTQNENALGLVTVGTLPRMTRSDGADIWVSVLGGSGSVARVRASDGALLQTWTGTSDPYGIVVAAGLVIVAGSQVPGKLYTIDPRGSPGAATLVASNLGRDPGGITFDGSRVWTANQSPPGSVSIITPGATIPWSTTTVTVGFNQPWGALFDGSNVWVTDQAQNALFRLDPAGTILQTVTVGTFPSFPAFDGTNIWVPNGPGSVTVVRASTGAVLRTLTGNGLASNLVAAAFDGERILVTSQVSNTLSLWKAADMTPLGSFSTGAATGPFGACSDGVNFWIALLNGGKIARF